MRLASHPYNCGLLARTGTHARAPMNSMYPKNPMTEGHVPNTLEPSAGKAAKRSGRRIQVRRSGVHGKGVYALAPIAKGERIVEYTGQIITWKQALKRHPHDPSDPNHTFYFHIDDG